LHGSVAVSVRRRRVEYAGRFQFIKKDSLERGKAKHLPGFGGFPVKWSRKWVMGSQARRGKRGGGAAGDRL